MITLERLVELMSLNPRKRFGIPSGSDFAVFEVTKPYRVEPREFLSMGRATKNEGDTVMGRCVMTVCGGRAVYIDKRG